MFLKATLGSGLPCLLGAMFFLGCSDDTSKSTGPTTVPTVTTDPCSLVSGSDYAAITGLQTTHTVKETDGGDALCSWNDSADYTLFSIRILSDDPFGIKSLIQVAPLAGLGEDAFLGGYYTVYVKTSKAEFFVQSMNPVSDGKLSAPIQAADTSATVHKDILTYEASYRVAKIAVGKL